MYRKRTDNRNSFLKRIKKFTDAVGGSPEELTDLLYAEFQVECFDYSDDWRFHGAMQYIENTVIPHKIAVYQAGTELSRSEFFKEAIFAEEKEEFLYNLWVHDLSKLSANETIGYAMYNRKGGQGKSGFELAWHHHKMHNKHHPEYWLNPQKNGTTEPIAMPDVYILEMIADWIGAGKTYGSSIEEWLPKNIEQFTFKNNDRVAEIITGCTEMKVIACENMKCRMA